MEGLSSTGPTPSSFSMYSVVCHLSVGLFLYCNFEFMISYSFCVSDWACFIVVWCIIITITLSNLLIGVLPSVTGLCQTT